MTQMEHNYSFPLRRMLLASLFLLVLPAVAWADDFEVGGIFYGINDDGKSVTVKPAPEKYSGDIVIPSTVAHEGKTYGVTSIGNMVFALCDALTSISLPEGLTSIGDTVFWGCTFLPSIDFPSSLTSIGSYAFATCHSLASIDIPSGVTSIGEAAFGGCTSLASMTVSADNPVYSSREGCNAVIETETNTLIAGCRNTVIPSSVTSIGDYAFCWCTSLASMDLPSSVTGIGDYAFFGCSSLISMDLPSGVTSIGEAAFGGCSSLASVDIPSSVTGIGDHVFADCSSLTTVICRAEEVPCYEWVPDIRIITGCNKSEQQLKRVIGLFDNVPRDRATLYVPASTINAYKAADGWKEFETILPLEDYGTSTGQ